LRRIFGVKNSTTNWAVLRECGQEPLQFFWFRASIRLFNSMLDDSNSETQVSNAFNGLQDSAMFKQKMLRATQVPMQEFICDLRFRHLKVWREANLSCPRAVNKKAVTCLKWCGSSESGPRGSPFSIPSYLYKDLDKHVFLSPPICTRIWTNMCWGISAGSDCVHTIWEWSLANGMGVVINVSVEKFKMRSMCFYSASVLKCASCAWDTETSLKECLRLRVFAPSSSEFIHFLNCHHSITDFEINAFLHQDSYRLLKFVSDLVSNFDTGWFCFTSQLPSARDSGCRPS